MKEKLTFFLPRILLAFAIHLGLAIAGIYLLRPLSAGADKALTLSAWGAVAVLLCCYAVSPFLLIRFKNRLQQTDAKSLVDQLLSRRQAVLDDCLAVKKKLQQLRILCTCYILLLVAGMVFSSFVLGGKAIGASILWVLGFFGILAQIRFFPPRPDQKDILSEKDYPTLYTLAQKAADAVGVKEKICLVTQYGNNVGVLREGKTVYLTLGAITLGLMNEEEFYAVLIHEFTHIKNTDRATVSDRKLHTFFSMDHVMIFPALAYPAALYIFESELYRELSSVLVERLADQGIAAHGMGQIGAGALAKIEYYDLFVREEEMHLPSPFYAAESCPAHLLSFLLSSFWSALPKREAFWRSLIEKEISPRVASHPILRQRLEVLGVSDYTATVPEETGAFRAECRQMIACLEKEFYESSCPNYEAARKENYLKPLATVEQWEAEGKGYTRENFRTVASALHALYRFEDLADLCEEVIAKEQGGLVLYAKFVRGNLRLDRYDDRGIADLYEAAENNQNYTAEASERIGNYCCQTGLQEELEEYRRRSVTLMQKTMDEVGANDLKVSDLLQKEDVLSPELQQRNLDYILSVGKDVISRLFLVRKMVNPTLYSSVYVVEFLPGAPEDRMEDTMEKVFEFLDNTPEDWQYGWFFYDKETAAAVKKVEGSCIYQKEAE